MQDKGTLRRYIPDRMQGAMHGLQRPRRCFILDRFVMRLVCLLRRNREVEGVHGLHSYQKRVYQVIPPLLSFDACISHVLIIDEYMNDEETNEKWWWL